MESNTFVIGVLLTFVVYIVVSAIISRKVKTKNDYYVAGRNAPAFLIMGSLVASYISTGAFLGDVGEAYNGFFAGVLVVVAIQCVGYVVGSVFFGRFLRRSEALTIPRFFGQRFNSKPVQVMASITSIFVMTVYSLVCVQGIATLLSAITPIDYATSVVLAVVTFTVVAFASGAKGVIITDTIMFGIFSIATLVGVFYVANAGGGWFESVATMSTYEAIPGMLSGSGNLDYLYPTATENIIWMIGYGIAWFSVVMVSPWQSSRYLMAKNEHAAIRASVVAAIAVFLVEFLLLMAGVFIQGLNPGMESPSQAMIWASVNVMPTILGAVVIAGVVAAGISSGTTFLSLVGSNIVNDFIEIEDDRKSVRLARIAMVIVAIIIGAISILNPPAIFWIMYIGSSVIACAWLPVAIASIWSKRVTKTGAFWGMTVGFVVSAVLKVYTTANGIVLPVFLDPFFVGLASGLVALVIGSALTQVTDEERSAREKLFIMPDSEKDPIEIAKTKRALTGSLFIGAAIFAIMAIFWVAPYTAAIS